MKNLTKNPRRSQILLGAVAGMFLSGMGLAREDLYLFDFGDAASPVFAGFKQVTTQTVYSPEQGYGWESPGYVARQVGRRALLGAPDALMGDYVYPKGQDFIIDLPDQRYRVLAYVNGYTGTGRCRATGYVIKANGREVARLDWNHEKYLTEEYYFKDWDRDFDPADDVWERWIEDWHVKETFDVTPRNGQVRINFGTAMEIFGLIVYPAEKAQQADRAIRQIDRKRKEEFFTMFYNRRVPEPEPMPKLTREEKKKGYIVFSRHYQNAASFNEAPKRSEISKPLSMFAARGEKETVTFTVVTLADREEISVSAGGLKGEDGALPAARIRIQYLKFIFNRRGPDEVGPYGYYLTPWTRVKGQARYNRRFYLTVDVPEDARPGIYRGAVRVEVTGCPSTELPVRLRVLPFRLPTVKEAGLSTGYYYHSPVHSLAFSGKRGQGGTFGDRDDPKMWAWMEKDFRFMKEYNLNAPNVSMYSQPEIVDFDRLAEGDPSAIDFTRFDRELALARKAGLDGAGQIGTVHVHNTLVGRGRDAKRHLDMNSDEYRTLIGNFHRLLGEHVKEQGGPELVTWLADEIRESLKQGHWNLDHDTSLVLAKAVREGARGAIRTTWTLMADTGGGKDYSDLVPAVDVTQTHFWARSRKLIETANEGGHTLWSYNSGTSRYSWGFQLYRLGATGRWQWHWYWIQPNGDRPFSPTIMAYPSAVIYTPEGYYPTLDLLEAREGVDDYRYIALLEMKLKEGGSVEAVRQARAALDDVKQLEPFGIKLSDPEAVGGRAKTIFPSYEDYDMLRWRIAQAVMAFGKD